MAIPKKVATEQVSQLLSLKISLLSQLLEIGRRFNEIVKKQQVEMSEVESMTRQHGSIVEKIHQVRTEWDKLFPKLGDFRIWRRNSSESDRQVVDQGRTQARELMDEIRALNQGTQTTLVYTSNFYASFLEGLLSEEPVHSSYSSQGVVRQTSSGLIQADC